MAGFPPSRARARGSGVEDRHGIRTVAFVSLGCPKNLVDSEKMLGLLAESGLIPVSDESEADAIVVNTCGFLEASKRESLREVRRVSRLKQRGSCKRVVVAGCLVQRHRARLLEWCPQIDALIGVFDRDRIVEAVTGGPAEADSPPGTPGFPREDLGADLPIYSSIAGSAAIAMQRRGLRQPGYTEDDSARLRLTPRHYAYLRISEGCNQNCAFCTIPGIRGKMRSKPVDRILAEARELLADGAFELNLIGQDTTSYGQDIGYEPGLVGMLEALDRTVVREAGDLGGWVRLMYAYPSCFTDAMIDAVARLPRVVKYIDLPLQHVNDRVLDRMRRRTSRAQIEALLGKLRQRVPGITIRTTFISGFPGETEREHRELVRFVRDFGFDAMGVFTYSPEPGTPAGAWHAAGEAVPADVAAQRREELMLAQQEVAFARNTQAAADGLERDVLIDSPSKARPGFQPEKRRIRSAPFWYAGRGSHQAPQIDGVTYVRSREELCPGELVRCHIVGADGYDLVAQPVAELTARVSLPVVQAGHNSCNSTGPRDRPVGSP